MEKKVAHQALNTAPRGARADAVRQRAMESFLEAYRTIPALGRCADLAGISRETVRIWLRQGEQLAVAAGRMEPSILEGMADVPIPAGKRACKQVEDFAVEFQELKRVQEMALVGVVRKSADGYTLETVEHKYREGQWVPSKKVRKEMPPEWRAAVRLLEMGHEDYRKKVGISAEIRGEVEGMTPDELRAELFGEEDDED